MRQFMVLAAFAAVLGAGTTANAADAPAKAHRPANQCFLAQDVDGFTRVDNQNVDVTVGPRNVYRLTLFSPSPDIDWSMRIGLEARGSSWICSGLDATVIVPSDIGPQRYPVTKVRKLSPDEIAQSRHKAHS